MTWFDAAVFRDDPIYALSKAAKRGLSTIPRAFEPLADRIEKRFGPRPLWIGTDTIPRAGSRHQVRPRLNLVFERTEEYKLFESSPYSFDRAKQASIARAFEGLISPRVRRRLFRAGLGNKLAGDLFVCFHNFEPSALEEMHLAVPMNQIDALADRFFGDAYWQSSRLWSAPVIFLHTDGQVESFKGHPVLTDVDDAYRSLAAQHDEFGYFNPTSTFVSLDSKQNFDEHYSSNWYYYWK